MIINNVAVSKNRLGFFMITPKYFLLEDKISGVLFNQSIIFTPKPGLFGESNTNLPGANVYDQY